MKRIITILLIVAMTVAVAACGGDSAQKQPANNIVNTGKTYDGLLRIFVHKPDTLCPILTKSESGSQMLRLVFDSLVSLNEDLTAEACLATDWYGSEDGKTWTLNLRNDVKWHDGNQFDANDVVYTVRQIEKNEDSIYSYNVSNIAEVRAKDTFVVEFELNSPWINFVNLLNFPIIQERNDDVSMDGFSPVGTGAYVFSNDIGDSEYHLLRNDGWWGGKPASECVAVRILADTETAMYAFDAGDIDLILSDATDWGKYIGAETSAYKSVETGELTFVGINNRKGALSCSEVRRAISYSVNRQQMIDEIMLGFATATTTPANPRWKISEGVGIEIKHDPETAKTELESAGWKMADSGYWHKTVEDEYMTTVFKIIYNEENSERKAVAQMLETNLESAGIDITLEELSFEEYLSRIQNGEYDLFVGSTLLSPDASFSFVLKDENVYGFHNEETLALRDNLKTGNVAEQANLYAPLIQSLHQENPVVSLFFKKHTLIYNKRVEGEFRTTAFEAYKGIETQKKKEATK